MIFKKSTLFFACVLSFTVTSAQLGNTDVIAPIVEHSPSMIETIVPPASTSVITSPGATEEPMPAPTVSLAAALQSPIDIEQATEKNLPDIKFNYPASMQFDLSFTGHTVQATVAATDAAGNNQFASIELNGKTYNLVQIHMHAPSEHTILHKRYPLEWHFVHQSSNDKSRAVIGVFMEDAKETTPAYRTLLDAIQAHVTEDNKNDHIAHTLGSCSFSPRDLIPEDQRCWRYNGSLTSAPYSPVYWCVVRATTSIDAEDMENLFTAMQVNTRGLQELDNREVLFDSTLDNAPIQRMIAPKKAATARRKITSRTRAGHPHRTQYPQTSRHCS